MKKLALFFLFISAVLQAAESSKEEPKPAFLQPIPEIKLTNGAVFRNVSVVRYEKETVILKSSAGVGPLLYRYIPEPLRSQMVVERDIALSSKEAATKRARVVAAKMEEAKRDLETAELERQKKFEDAIGHKNIMVGMSSDQVRRSWGSPERINSSGGISGSHEQWIYGDDYVYFDADKLTSWQSRR